MDPVSLAAAFELPDLTDAESAELAVAAQAGDQAACNELVCRHVRLISHMARIFAKGSADPVTDLFQDGVITLLDCIERFDVTLHVPFRAWAAQQLRFHFWKHITRKRRYRAAIQAYTESLDPDASMRLSDADVIYETLVDLCMGAEKQGLINRRHTETFLLRARGMPDKYIMKEQGIVRSIIRKRLLRTIKAIQKVASDDE